MQRLLLLLFVHIIDGEARPCKNTNRFLAILEPFEKSLNAQRNLIACCESAFDPMSYADSVSSLLDQTRLCKKAYELKASLSP